MFEHVNWGQMTGLMVVFGIFVLPQLGKLLSGSKTREQNHAARMKALEMGHPDPALHSPWPRALTCIAIGAGVPIGTACFAWMASRELGDGPATQGPIWGVTLVISIVAVGCGTGLATTMFGSRGGSGEPRKDAKPPAYDPESFEAVSHLH